MPFDWRSSAEVFAQRLPHHGLDAEAAWRAFADFVQVEFDVDAGPDADGFLVQWGRDSWNGGRPSLTFTRQFSVTTELWQVSLELLFDEAPDVSGNTGFSFAPRGGRRRDALAEMRTAIDNHPDLWAIWQATPCGGRVSLDRAD